MLYRIYYNNSTDRQRWSIDQGSPDTEICVIGVEFLYVRVVAVTTDDDTQPRAWIETSSPFIIINGVAVFQ